ncbi:RNA methyltransferase [Phenylobacterium sp. LjRoot225]|uniref:TrmH family RNA methyltransferase n=1 Tax=Phenylobacterium sp. LjRoot225 TaxID=3342285 RepID=UPI003ECC8C6D
MALVIPVSDPGDPRIAPYRAVRERDLVGREGLFVAEGRVVLEKLVRAGRHPICSLLVAEARLAGLQPVLDALAPDIPVYAAPQGVMDAIAGFPVHRGVLGIGQRQPITPHELLARLGPSALVVGLSAIANHDNMGGIFRNAAAFGAEAVLLDAACCDPLYRKAIRVSVGAALTTPFARLDVDQDLAQTLAAAGLEVVALSPRGEVELADLACGPRVAALFGAEGPGLAPELLARTRTVRIEMAQGFDSLNVATTSGMVLYQLSKRCSAERRV